MVFPGEDEDEEKGRTNTKRIWQTRVMEMKAPQREKEEEVNGHVRNDMSTSEKRIPITNPQPDIELHTTNTPQSMPETSPTHQPPQASKSNKTTSPPDTHPVDVPPNGGYGWICVAAVATINGHTWGLNSAYAVFLAHYLSTSTFPGATPLQYAFIGGLSISQALIVSPVATYTTRRFGTRTTLFIGVFFETVSFIGASFASSIWHLFLSQGVCFGWGMGFLFVGSVGIAAQWFTTHRSLANGCCAAGSGLGGLIYSLAAQAMIRNIGLPWAFRTLAVIAGVVNSVCALVIRDRNKEVGSRQVCRFSAVVVGIWMRGYSDDVASSLQRTFQAPTRNLHLYQLRPRTNIRIGQLRLHPLQKAPIRRSPRFRCTEHARLHSPPLLPSLLRPHNRANRQPRQHHRRRLQPRAGPRPAPHRLLLRLHRQAQHGGQHDIPRRRVLPLNLDLCEELWCVGFL